jgi:hypothetical protein
LAGDFDRVELAKTLQNLASAGIKSHKISERLSKYLLD